MLYEYDGRSVTGHSEIDRLHVEIADQSRRLVASLEQGAGFDEIYDAFMQLQDVLRIHFNVEEHDMMLLEQNFEELKNIDQEMSALFTKYDPKKSASD